MTIHDRMKVRTADVLGHQIAYAEWGDEAAPPVVCWHGIGRTGHVFRSLAGALSDRYRVICPDLIGRGLSTWSSDPETEYRTGYYSQIAEALLDRLGIERSAWVGISLGGAIGIRAAGGVLRDRVSDLVLVDVGPTMEPTASGVIAQLLAQAPQWRSRTLGEFQERQQALYRGGGPLTEDEWLWQAAGSVRRTQEGDFTESYDPAISVQLEKYADDFQQWDFYDRINARTLLIRGADSTLISAATAREMTRRGPRCQLIEIPGVAHAPQLVRLDEIEMVVRFLDGD